MTKLSLCYLWLEFLDSEAGGAVSHMKGFLLGLKNLGIGIYICTPKRFVYFKEYKNVFSLESKKKLDFLMGVTFSNYGQIKANIKAAKPALVYQRHVGFTDLGARLARDLKVPLFLEFNGSISWITKQWARGWRKYAGRALLPVMNYYEQKSLKSATRIFVVSNAMKNAVLSLGIPEEKIILNPNGVDTKKFNPKISGVKVRNKYGIPKNAIAVGFIGTFGRWHGAEILAEAAKEIVQKKEDVYFLFMGEGYYKKQAEEAAGKNERIIFTGPVPRDEVPNHLAACDILVNPTVPNPDGTEFFGSPTKLFEYMAMGKAIISSNIGQMKESLEDKKDALLVEAGNSLVLEETVLALAEDKKMREPLGRNARNKVEKKYTWEMNAKRVLKAYEELQ